VRTDWIDCPVCYAPMACEGFGADAVCLKCRRAWETDWDYTSDDSMAAWVMAEITEPARLAALIAEARAS
jgi:hypothetical protein